MLNFTSINPNGTDWFRTDKIGMRSLSKLAGESNETFSSAIFLHKSPLIKRIKDQANKRTKVGEEFGEVDLSKTMLPRHIPKQVTKSYFLTIFLNEIFKGFLAVALDPLENISDIDRSDNYFIQFVRFQDDAENKPFCDVSPVKDGRAVVSFFDQFEGTKHVELTGKGNSLKKVELARVNKGRLQNKLKMMRNIKGKCKGYQEMLDKVESFTN